MNTADDELSYLRHRLRGARNQLKRQEVEVAYFLELIEAVKRDQYETEKRHKVEC